ncbi:unnamed protein product [Rotaria sordida]|uniref:Uncharacterized protein n=1 Tax=Rotaria sordida TaxID=392033 RepID=A0A819KF12_9BILA|nr:unnamed protein product [Rotaria sordida]CAF3947966.1 unnamed protein product [Rotaria sordida]
MFKAYASSESSAKNEEEKKPIVPSSSSSSNNNSANESTWLENKSFSTEPSIVPFQQRSIISTKSDPLIDVKPKEEKKPIAKPIQHIISKKKETNDDVFYIDRRRDRANITVQYTHGVPRYGAKFCNQRPLGSRIIKPSRKQRIIRYFHHKLEDIDNQPSDSLVTVDNRLEQLNITVREQPHSFDAWKELIDYQFYLFKTNGQQEKLTALYKKQLSIVDRALELNSNRLQYRLLKLNIRTRSHLFDHDTLLNEWTILIKDCQKSSDDRTINETWFSYIQFILNRIEVFSIDKLNDIFIQYFSTYAYHIQTRSEKERRFLLNHMIGMKRFYY